MFVNMVTKMRIYKINQNLWCPWGVHVMFFHLITNGMFIFCFFLLIIIKYKVKQKLFHQSNIQDAWNKFLFVISNIRKFYEISFNSFECNPDGIQSEVFNMILVWKIIKVRSLMWNSNKLLGVSKYKAWTEYVKV